MVNRAGEIVVNTHRKTVGPLAPLTNDIIEIAAEIGKIGQDLTAAEAAIDAIPGGGGGDGGPVSIVASAQAFAPNAELAQLSTPFSLDNGDGSMVVGGLSCPRTIALRITGQQDEVTGGTVTINGISNKGEVIQDIIQLADVYNVLDPDYLETSNAYAVVTSALVAGIVLESNNTGDELVLYEGTKFGLPVPAGAEDISVFYSSQDGGTPGTVDQTYGTIHPTTPFAGDTDYAFYFKYTAPAALA